MAAGGRRRGGRRSKVRRVVNFVKRIIAFFISHVGLCALVIAYTALGAVTFRAIESPFEIDVQKDVFVTRTDAVRLAWNVTFTTNRINPPKWRRQLRQRVKAFQLTLFHTIRHGYDGKQLGVSQQWTFTGAFLYSLSVITTIENDAGYGNTTCKTYFGKTITIMYAIIGIPLLLLFLTNVGDVFAKVFRFLYRRSLILKMQLTLWHKGRQAARLRRANSLVSRVTKGSQRSGGSRERRNNQQQQQLQQQQQQDSLVLGMGGNFEQLVTAQAQLEQLEVKEAMERELIRADVPLTLVVATMIAYFLAGSLLFHIWEGWPFHDSFYFCYISLFTIGFGDLYPGRSVGADDSESQEKLMITSIYLMVGMAMLSMCINLAQEQVVSKVLWLASKLGMIGGDDDDDDEDDIVDE